MKYLTFLFALFSFISAQAEDLKYEAYWNGIKAGTAQVTINETETTYSARVRAEAQGLVKKFNPYWTDSKIEGSISNGVYKPSVYDMNYKPKKSQGQRVVVTYAKDGAVSEVATPPEKRSKRPVVAPEDKNGLPDPITAGLIARIKVRELMTLGKQLPQEFTIRMFDSRRVTDLEFKIIGYKQMRIGAGPQKLLELAFNRVPVTGYNKRELEKAKEDSPLIHLYVNEEFLPVYAVGQSVIGEVNIKLVNK